LIADMSECAWQVAFGPILLQKPIEAAAEQ
jgi:hypothetical protein